MDSATIVSAALDSRQLEDSINKLVQTVASKTKEMADNFTSEVARMEQTVKNLGNIKIGSGSTADGGSSRRTSSLKQEEQQVKNVATSYDGLAKAQQTAIGSRGGSALKKDINEAANSYSGLIQQIERTQAKFDISPIQNLRMRQHELEAGMQTAANEAAKAKKDVDELNAAIANYRATLETLPKNGQGFSNRQAIQKEINDLITLRDVSSSEQQKWEAASRQLASQYEVVKNEIRQIGQALIAAEESEKHATTELDKQLQKIKEINSSKNAKAVYESISAMPTNTIEQANLKLQALQALKEKVANTPLLSKSSQSQLIQTITDTKGRIEQIEMAVRGTNQSKKSLDELNAAIIQNIRREEERRNAILRTGIAAQEAFAKIRQSTQIQFADNTDKPIMGVKELTEAIRNMERAYWGMDAVNRESPLGQSLQRDIENAQKLRTAIEAYNKTLLGLPVIQDKSGIDKTLGSYTELSALLKTLSDEYRHLGREERNAAKGNDLADKIQRLGRETLKIQQQMNRPINLDAALKGSEKTIDDITYKIRRLQSYKVGIDLTKPNAANEIKQVDEAILRLQKDMDKYLGKSKDIIANNNAIGRSWNYMKNRLAFYFTVGASTQFIKNLIEVRSQYEMNERALGILINSAERGTQIFNELSQMALVSPYTLIELSNAAKQLTAYDIAAKDVVDTTRRLADMASAVGVPMERLTYALGQIKAYGYLNSRDARMFANAGIPLVRELSKYYSELEGKVVSVGDVYDRMKKKAIDYNSVMAVVTKMTDEGGKFFDFQAKMADTLKVQLANLTLAWNNMLNDLGSSQQGVLVGGIAALKNLFLHWQDIYDVIQKVVYAFGLYKLAQAASLMWTGRITTAMGMQELVGKKLQARLAGLAAANKSFVAASTMGWMTLAAVVVEVLYTWNRNVEEIERLNKTIADGAKESAKSLGEFLESVEITQARLSAQTNKLPKADAEKTWESLREQIELSSMSSDKIIPKLLEIGNLNERLTTAFDLAERIKDANEKLSGLENSLDISQDTILGGLLGEGLIEDIEDYNEHLAYSAEKAEYFTKSNHGFWENAAMGLKALYNEVRDSMGSSTDEAEAEIRNFAKNAAQTIKDELGEEGIKDNIKVNEAIARVISGVEQMFPQLRGKGKLLFETMFNDIMATEFEGAVDKQAYYYKLFLERLKKDHASAFQDVTEDINRETFVWSDAQLKAIEKTANNVKTDLPEAAQKAIDDIVNNLNRQEFKMRIVAEFATSSLDDINKAFRRRFIEAGTDAANAQIDATQKGLDKIKDLSPWGGGDAGGKTISQKETENLQKFGSLMRKQNESDLDYQERIRKERQKKLDIQATEAKIIAANTGREDEGAKAVLASAQEQKKAADDWLDAASQVEKWGGYDFSTKKENTAATKAQHAAETELQKALKDELQLIDRVRSQYKKLVDAGANSGEALAYVTNQFGNSLARINSILGKNGIPLFDISKFAGTDNPQALLDMLKLQLDSAKIAKNIKPEEIKELEVKYSEIVVDAKAYNLTKITKGLNNELDKLKEEYELAVALDADPELGSMFADWMGIDVNDLPRTASEYAERASKELNKYLRENKANVELPNLLNVTDDDLRAFEEMKVLTDAQLENVRKRVQQARELQRKEASDQIKDWDKLLEKYAEYETKISKIQNDAVKERVTFAQQFGSDEEKSLALNLQTQILAATDPQEKQKLIEQLQNIVKNIAGDDKTKLNIVTAITNSEQQGIAKTNFEEFQKSPEWIAATGDLAGMTTRAIGGLISSLERYKKTAKDLTPKQIKQINNALKSLHKQQRQGNPFLQIADAIDRAKERAEEFQPEMDAIMSDIIALEKEIGDNDPTEEQAKHLKSLKDRWKELASIGKVSASEYVDAINNSISAASQAISMFTDMADALGGQNMTEASKTIKDVVGVLEKAGQGAAMGAQIGGGYGAIIGAVAGGLAGAITTWADVWSGNAAITDKVKESERAVKRLTASYSNLEYIASKAYGAIKSGADDALISNKKLQLAELEHQLELEKSRSSKNRDEERIEELTTEITELRNEIKKATTDIVNDILGISDAEDGVVGLVDAMINAFRNGEDAMAAFGDKWDEMIDNMITKLLVTTYMQKAWDNVMATLEQKEAEFIQKASEERANAMKEYDYAFDKSDDEIAHLIAERLGYTDIGSSFDRSVEEIEQEMKRGELNSAYSSYTGISQVWIEAWQRVTDEEIRAYRNMLEQAVDGTESSIDKASVEYTKWSLDYMNNEGREYMTNYAEMLKGALGDWYRYGQDSQNNLSALQQGIQGITEDTAGALEAYMNGVSQQVYLHSELLTQIRDAIMGTDSDIQLGVQGQMLLQLQNNYIIMQSIQSMMEGWTTPSGQGIRVELIS